MRLRSSYLSLLLILNFVVTESPALPEPFRESQSRELIVLLSAGGDTPSPAQVVDIVNRGAELPDNLGVGAPVEARFGLHWRARGAQLQQLESESDSPRSRLERYVVLRYSDGVDLAEIQRVLSASRSVLHVEENLPVSFSPVSPSDPLFPIPDPLNPDSGQWGPVALNLEKAWGYATGHATVGVVGNGIAPLHEDLRAFDLGASGFVWEGGPFRPGLARNVVTGQPNVDEVQSQVGTLPTVAGHGTHVAGIIAANGDNGVGTTGICWNCSLIVAKASRWNGATTVLSLDNAAEGFTWALDNGAQIINLSFGYDGSCADGNLGMFCTALAFAHQRQVTVVAASGNDKLDIEAPASDPRVIAVGGISADGSFWDREAAGVCPCQQSPPLFDSLTCAQIPTIECGSNFTLTPSGAMQDLVAPADGVLSTTYPGFEWSLPLGCGDGTRPGDSGYGLCTGTSMASAHVAGQAAVLRSINPLLSHEEIREVLTSTADRAGAWDPRFGHGIPDSADAVRAAMGTAVGQVLTNRLTPLFNLYSQQGESHLSTTAPQIGSAAFFGPEVGFTSRPWGPGVPHLDAFPGTCGVGCPPPYFTTQASAYLFTTDTPPAPQAPPLVPLYRMLRDGPWAGNPDNYIFFYTTDPNEMEAYRNVGYHLMAQEGYIYDRCTPEPECIPEGTERLYRMYNSQRGDIAIFPESELARFQQDGYTPFDSEPWIGYAPSAYQDSDGDDLIDAFEILAGTDPAVQDSDGDGIRDDREILVFPYSEPRNDLRLFSDDFENGDSGNWTSPPTTGNGTIQVDEEAASTGSFGLRASVSSPEDRAYLVDFTPDRETSYRLSLDLSTDLVSLAEGKGNALVTARDDIRSKGALKLSIRATSDGIEIQAGARQDDRRWIHTPWAPISGWTRVALEWKASNFGPNTGSLRLRVDGEVIGDLTDLDIDEFRIDRLHLGAVSGIDPGTEGDFLFDEVVSFRGE